MSRAFYEACENAIEAKTHPTAIKHIQKAQSLIGPLIALARSRLELRTVADLVNYLNWSVAWCEYNLSKREEYPGLDWPFFHGAFPPSPLGRPPMPTNRASIDHRWSTFQDRPTTNLPSVPMRTWPYFPEHDQVIEIAR